ncbi:unnamed protein product [Cuscuta campestris]|uniref:SWIM-type domain-containing protein n=1 Tax=Cuscuta campestris TaxID=132261 RepID=A0A484L3F9_9ASTE|nr:unnamed protein product [Cuscuta campestris]
MDSHIKVLVRVGGTWDTLGNFSSKYDTVIDVRNEVSLKSLMDTIKADISMDWYQNDIRFSYMVALCPPPIVIADDSELLFYLRLKSYQNDVPYLPLCMEVLPTATVAQLNGQANSSCALSPDINICYNSHSVDSTPNLTGQSNTNHMSIKISSGKSDHSNSMKRTSQTKRRRHPTNPVDVISHYHPTTLQVDSIYKSKQDLYHHLQMYAVSNSFQYKTKRSNRTVLHVVCVDARCSWAVRAVSLDNSPLFQIRRFDSYHSCPVDLREGDHRQATSTFLADLVLHCYVEATRKQYPPNDIWDDMRREFGIAMSYRKALLVKQKALKKLYGSDEESYQLLPSLCYMLETKNPGSSIRLTRSEDQRFKYLFFSLAPWRQAWNHCAPILVIDGTFMKSYYKGTLLTACGQDANKQLVPIAFGICDAEDKDSWMWFLSELKTTLTPRHDLYIMSDRHEGIIHVVQNSFPNAGHGYCTEHIARNLRTKFKGPKEDLTWKFRKASRAATEVECEEYLQNAGRARPQNTWTQTFVVNLRDKSCTCGDFQLDHFVCVHAVAAIGSRPGLSCYNFISPYYKREALVATYSGIVHPIGDKSTWDIPSDVKTMVCKPPLCNKRPLGGQRRGGYHPLVNFISAKVGKSRSVPGA